MTTAVKTRSDKTYHDDLAIVREELDKCMKCGNCMSVCPVYGADKLETSVTRSKTSGWVTSRRGSTAPRAASAAAKRASSGVTPWAERSRWNRLRRARGLPEREASMSREDPFDLLAAHLEQHLDVNRILARCGLPC